MFSLHYLYHNKTDYNYFVTIITILLDLSIYYNLYHKLMSYLPKFQTKDAKTPLSVKNEDKNEGEDKGEDTTYPTPSITLPQDTIIQPSPKTSQPIIDEQNTPDFGVLDKPNIIPIEELQNPLA